MIELSDDHIHGLIYLIDAEKSYIIRYGILIRFLQGKGSKTSSVTRNHKIRSCPVDHRGASTQGPFAVGPPLELLRGTRTPLAV